MSYVTGSHNLKFGMTLDEGTWRQGTDIIGPTDSLLFTLGGRPLLIAAFATPYNVAVDLAADLGLYMQDTWTIDRTTFNLGLRWDYVRQDIPAHDTSSYVDLPAGSVPSGTWAPTRRWDAIPNAANWKDLSPRLGVAHDVFGDGKTAIKGSISRYLRVDTIGMSASRNPVNASITNATRSSGPTRTATRWSRCSTGSTSPSTRGSAATCSSMAASAWGEPVQRLRRAPGQPGGGSDPRPDGGRGGHRRRLGFGRGSGNSPAEGASLRREPAVLPAGLES